MTSEPGPHDREPISPELVLVSPPELARRARDELPLPPPANERASTVPATARPAQPPRRRLRRLLVACILAALGAGAWYVTAGRDERGPADAAAVPAVSPTKAGSPAHPQVAPTQTNTAEIPKPPPPSNVAKPARKPKISPGPTKPPVGFVPARTWAWTPSRGARGYVFQLALNGRTVLRVSTKQPRVVLPRSFRFHAGRYRWTVRQVPAAPGARPLGDSTFILTAAVARRANR
jgi:hypothetical protein